jgi:hypothetical protein
MSNQIMELRFVKRQSAATSDPGNPSVAVVREVKILQQRLKSGVYAQWGEWHDVPTVEPEDE